MSMAKSENTHCLILTDLEELAEVFEMSADERNIYFYCIRQGAKNNLGIFVENRGGIAMKLRIKDEICNKFFTKYPDLIGFDPETHLIWIKRIFDYMVLGIDSEIWKEKKDKKTGKSESVLCYKAIKNRNRFISKVKSEFRENKNLKNHKWIKKEWVKHNFEMLKKINDEVKLWEKNKHNLDLILREHESC